MIMLRDRGISVELSFIGVVRCETTGAGIVMDVGRHGATAVESSPKTSSKPGLRRSHFQVRHPRSRSIGRPFLHQGEGEGEANQESPLGACPALHLPCTCVTPPLRHDARQRPFSPFEDYSHAPAPAPCALTGREGSGHRSTEVGEASGNQRSISRRPILSCLAEWLRSALCLGWTPGEGSMRPVQQCVPRSIPDEPDS